MAGISDETSGATPRQPDAAVPRPATPSPRSPRPISPPPPDADLGIDRIVQDIREGLAEITARELELRRREHAFDRRYRDMQQAAHVAATEEHEDTQQPLADQLAALNSQAVEIAALRARLEDDTRELRAQKLDLEGQRRELALQAQRARQQADALQALHTQQEEAIQQRIDQVTQSEAELRERVRQADADIARKHAELAERCPELEARAARLRDAEQALLTRRAELDRRLSEAKAHVTRLKQQTPAQLPPPNVAAPTAVPALQTERSQPVKSSWRLRSTALAVVVAALAGAAWLIGHPSLYQATAELCLARTPTSDAAAEAADAPDVAGGLPVDVLAEHRRRLVDPQLLADTANSELNAAWSAACATGRVEVTAIEGEPVLRLTANAPDAAQAARLASAAATTYAEYLQTHAVGSTPPDYEHLLARRDHLEAAVTADREQQSADTTELTAVPDPLERDEADAAAKTMESELANIATALDQQRAEMAALLASDVPLGSVDPADAEKALSEDAIYLEDLKESQAVALQYRTELSVAMLQLVDPLGAVKKALTQFAASLAEQRGQDPPAEIAPVIEQCAADVSRLLGRVTPFTEQWQSTLQTIQSMNVRDDVVELVKQQNSIADTARRLADEAVAGAAQLGQRIESLNAGGTGGTRAVVVGAVLRSDHTAVDSSAKMFAAVAAKTALAGNFELDTLDRKLRGLRTRLAGRREAVNQRLQLDADHAARQKHTARVEENREQIRRLDQHREELVTSMLATLRRLRTLDEAGRRRDALEGRIRQREAEIAWLDARHADVVKEITATLERWPAPGTVEVRGPVIASISQTRYRDAGLAALVGFGVTWLICALLVAPLPWRRRRDDTSPEAAPST